MAKETSKRGQAHEFPAIPPVDDVHKAAHDFMLWSTGYSLEHIEGALGGIRDEVVYWMDQTESDCEIDGEVFEHITVDPAKIALVVEEAIKGKTAAQVELYR